MKDLFLEKNMLNSTSNNLLNTNIHNQSRTYTKSSNLYYNIFSKKMEAFDIPNLDLEFNAAIIPEKTTFVRSA